MNTLRIVIIFCFFIISKSAFTQDAKSPTGIYSDKVNSFYVEAFKENETLTGNCKSPLKIIIRTKGVCPENIVLSWQFTFYNCEGIEDHSNIKISIPKGETNFLLSKVYKVRKLKTIIDETPSKKIVTPPTDFHITGDANILEGATAVLSINTSNNAKNVRWLWYKQGEASFFKEGAQINVSPLNTTTYFLRSEVEGFLSKPQSFVVKVKLKPEPPKDFEIVAPKMILEGDTAILTVQIGTPTPGVKWLWYQDRDDQPFIIEENIYVSPINTTKYWLQADLNGKKSPFKSVTLNVKKIPDPPNDFSISGPQTIKEGEKAILKIVCKSQIEGLHWMWFKNNEVESFQEGESITVSPGETVTYQVKANTHKKKSAPKAFTLHVEVRSQSPSILGDMRICFGQNHKGTYSISGGKLGTGSSNWQWYEGICGSEILIGSGNVIELILPAKTTTYFVRPDADKSLCKEFKIEVLEPAIIPNRILISDDNVCPNQQFTLTIEGGKLMGHLKWVWYYQQAGSTKKYKLGEGATITTNAEASTNYFVRAEDGICYPTTEVSKLVTIYNRNNYNGYISKTKIKRNNYQLTAIGTPPSSQYKIAWYKDGCGREKIGTGTTITKKASRKGNKIFMRPEGTCDTLMCTSINLLIDKKYREKYFFFNLGISTKEFSNITNGMVTIGTKLFYLRTKFNIKEVLHLIDKSNERIVPAYECDNSGILNYPVNPNSYYGFNGEIEDNRTSYTLGFMFGVPNFRFYLGGGYGKRDLFWGADIYQNGTDQLLYSKWAKNIKESISGVEGEAGFFLKISAINLMGGVSTIYSQTTKQYYFDVHAGIGLSFRKK